MFEFRHLRYFVAVAEELNFTRAAERLNTAQPSVSQQIRSLEDYLGIRLLARSNRKVELTSAGERFLEEARIALAQVEKAVVRARGVEKEKNLKLGFNHALSLTLLPHLLPRIEEQFPNTEFSVKSLSNDELLRSVQGSDCDIAFTNIPSSQLRSYLLFSQRLIAVFRSRDPLATQVVEVPLASLRETKVVVDGGMTSSIWLRKFREKCNSIGVELDIREAGNLFEALALVLSGSAIGIFEEDLGHMLPRGMSARRLEAVAPIIEVYGICAPGVELSKMNRILTLAKGIGEARKSALLL